jgi:hypothetical protein
MSLHIRVATSFWTHRKTLRLHALIGEAAYWVPLKLWSYAATNQPDGNLSDYSDEEIAMLIGYKHDAKALLEALLKASFVDSDRKIHDWYEHNGFHTIFAERARNAANHRWTKVRLLKEKKKTRQDKTVQDKTRQETSIASSMLVASTQLRWSKAEGWKGVSNELLDEFKEAYPACDIKLQFAQMSQWLKANPSKARKSNWRRFATNWLKDEQDRGGNIRSHKPRYQMPTNAEYAEGK